MAVHSSLIREALNITSALKTSDLRRHRRMPIELPGRFMRADRQEYTCFSKNISVGGAALMSESSPDLGERVVIYLEHLGGLEATVTRHFPAGFGCQFKATEYKREKLASQIMWLMNRDEYPDELGRKHERIGTRGRRTTLKAEEGIVIDVELLDLSASGASLGTPARPLIGSLVMVGKSGAIVRRHHANGVGVQFIKVLTPEALRESFP